MTEMGSNAHAPPLASVADFSSSVRIAMSDIDLARVMLERVRYKDGWTFIVGLDSTGVGVCGYWLQVRFPERCTESGEMKMQHGRKWRLSPHMTRSEIVQTALAAVLAAEEHESRERFTYDGLPIFGPHFDVDKLRDLYAGRVMPPGINLDIRP